MTGRDTPPSDSVVNLLGEAGVPGDPALLRALEGVGSLGAGPTPEASVELAQLMAAGGRIPAGRRNKRRISFIGGALAVSMGVGMSGVAAGTFTFSPDPEDTAGSGARFAARESADRAEDAPPAVTAPAQSPKRKAADDPPGATAPAAGDGAGGQAVHPVDPSAAGRPGPAPAVAAPAEAPSTRGPLPATLPVPRSPGLPTTPALLERTAPAGLDAPAPVLRPPSAAQSEPRHPLRDDHPADRKPFDGRVPGHGRSGEPEEADSGAASRARAPGQGRLHDVIEGPGVPAGHGTPAPDPHSPNGPDLTSAPDGIVFFSAAMAAPWEHGVFSLFLDGSFADPGVWAPDAFLPVQPEGIETPQRATTDETLPEAVVPGDPGEPATPQEPAGPED